jgi:HSP20 family protein
MTAIIRRNPAGRLALVEPLYRPTSLLDEVEALAREVFNSRPLITFGNGFTPSLDIYREKDELVVKAELPGIKKKDLDISLEDDLLTVKAEKKEETVGEDTTHYTRERHFGQYSRSVKLPFPIDAEKTLATFKNGLLEIRLPKAEETKSKHIEVKVK